MAAAIQRCQVHKGRNIIERLPLHLHASVKKALRQAWDQDDADKAERLLRNLARRLEHEEPGVSGSILEGLDEILMRLAGDVRIDTRPPAGGGQAYSVSRSGRLIGPASMPGRARNSAALALPAANIVENALGSGAMPEVAPATSKRWRGAD